MTYTMLIEDMTKVAFNFGPFFFSVILIFYIWIKSKKNYTEICMRKDPKPSDGEIATHRKIYLATSLLTAIFMIFSSTVWLFFKTKKDDYVYHFCLADISEYEILTPRGDPIFEKRIVQGGGKIVETKYTVDYILLTDKKLTDQDTVIINYVNNEDEYINGIIEFKPLEMAGKRYLINRKSGTIDIESDKVNLKLDGYIIGSRKKQMEFEIRKRYIASLFSP